MCGFAGCLRLNAAAEPDAAWVAEASRMLAHRGPDGDGLYQDGDIALGARRLRVADLTPTADQPIASALGRFRAVFNGEIYNHVELRAALEAEGVRFEGTGDGEVLVELFARLGPAGLRELRGMYALAIWDIRERELFVARDPFGIKPLFVAATASRLRFASEKKALMVTGGPHELDRDALRRYLSFGFVPPGETMSPDVRELLPGQTLRASPDRGVELHDARPVTLRPRNRGKRDTAGVLDALRDSVHAHLRSDVPVGALLSGGIDSATVCALAAERVPDLPTFSVGFEREGFSELELAQETAAELGLSCTTYVVTAGEFVSCLPRIAWHLDDPLADAAAVPLWFVTREARRQVSVVLSGEGADELFAGYHSYRDPGLVDGTDEVPHHYIGAEPLVGDEVNALVPGGRGYAADTTTPIHREARAAGLDTVTTKQLVDLRTWLPGDILLKADRLSMAHGLELRVPFLDRAVLDVAAELGVDEKVVGATTKLALRRAVEDLLPPSVVNRPKLGFPVPIGHWLRGELADWAEDVLRESQVDRYLRRDVALDLLHRYQGGAEFSWRPLWALIMFCVWHQVHVEGRFDADQEGWTALRNAAAAPGLP
jgi:asparagine synthase (glutamine-hydrolysing)